MDPPLRPSTNLGARTHSSHGSGKKLDATKRLGDMAETLRTRASSLRTKESQKLLEICEKCHDIAREPLPRATKKARIRETGLEQLWLHSKQTDEVTNAQNELEDIRKTLIACQAELDTLQKSDIFLAKDQAVSSENNTAIPQENSIEMTDRTKAECEVVYSAIKQLLEENYQPKKLSILPPGFSAPQIHPDSECCHRGIRGCYVIIILFISSLTVSVALGAAFTTHGKTMGDAFTLSSWVMAVGTFMASAVEAYHYPHCTCWKRFSGGTKGQKDIERQLLDQRID